MQTNQRNDEPNKENEDVQNELQQLSFEVQQLDSLKQFIRFSNLETLCIVHMLQGKIYLQMYEN